MCMLYGVQSQNTRVSFTVHLWLKNIKRFLMWCFLFVHIYFKYNCCNCSNKIQSFLLAEHVALGIRLLLQFPSVQTLVISGLTILHSPLWKQGQWYLLTCQPLIDWHSSPSSENWIYWTVEMECPCQTWFKRQSVTLSSTYKDVHK